MANQVVWNGLEALSHMCPSATVNNITNSAVADAKSAAQSSEADTVCMFGADDADGIVGEFRLWVSLSARSGFWMPPRAAVVATRPITATFLHHISDVVLPRSEKQMIEANARAHITLMADVKAVWRQRSSMQPVREAMRVFGLAETPVAIRGERSTPQPARLSLFNLCPKACDWIADNFGSHVTSLGSLVRGAVGADYTVAPRSLYWVQP